MSAFRHRLTTNVAVLSLMIASAMPATAARLTGFDVIESPGHAFGTASASKSLAAARHLGANTIAIVPFLWQPDPTSPNIQRGSDMPDEVLRLAIRQARALSLAVIVKPHVWVPGNWAGTVDPSTEQNWTAWFANYRHEMLDIANLAAEDHADYLAVGTELDKTIMRREWPSLIAELRAAFPGKLVYFAHDIDTAEMVPFWSSVDDIGLSLYPALGGDDDRGGRLGVMNGIARRIDALSERTGKPVLIGEIGLRSASGAAAKPWESAEERIAPAAPQLQAQVLEDWLRVLNRPTIDGVLVWRWFTDPSAGGLSDTDFTVQGKPAEAILTCAWKNLCAKP